MENNRKYIGKKVKHARALADLHQADIAKILKLNGSAISKIENNKRSVTADELKLIADITDQPLSFFYKEENKQEPKPTNKMLDGTGLTDEQLELMQKLIDTCRIGEHEPARKEKKGTG